jgi:hypothetical protein
MIVLMSNKHLDRIERESGVPGLSKVLSALPPTDLQSLLMEVYRTQSGLRRPADLLADMQTNRFVLPGAVSPLLLVRWEDLALRHLPATYEAVELSPCAPLGSNSVVAAADQNRAIATCRNVEVVSDSTNVLALLCSLRRKDALAKDPKSKTIVNLAARQRVLRPQQYSSSGVPSHFSLFALSSAGRDTGDRRFEVEALAQHLQYYLTILRAYLGESCSYTVSLTDFASSRARERLDRELLKPLEAQFPSLNTVFDDRRSAGRGYYRDLCFKLHVNDPSGQAIEVADGGSVDWSQRLLSNSKERMIISGIGSERVCSAFPSAVA